MNKKMTTLSLTLPLFIETLLRALLMNVDTFMLSKYSDKAVAAVGMIQQFGFFILVIYMMAATGASILISQYLGAKKTEQASIISQAALIYNLGLGLILSITLRTFSTFIVCSLKLEPEVELFAIQYLQIYVTFSIFQAVSLVFSSIVRSYGYSAIPMFVNFGANIINAIGNYLFIFGAFGFPELGVQGVAISTVFSQGVGAISLIIITGRIPEIQMFTKRKVSTVVVYIKKILKIGIPSAGEMLSYNLAQIAILYAVSALGTASLAAYTYTTNIARFSYIIALSLGNATQIIVGYHVGAKEQNLAFTRCIKNLKFGVLTSFLFSSIIAIFRFPIISLLTKDPVITQITALLLILTVIHETARPINLIVIAGLRGAGDVKYPVYTGIIMQWSISVSLAFIFGIHMGWAMTGIWMARLIEEWLRGGIILRRWYSRKWESKALVK